MTIREIITNIEIRIDVMKYHLKTFIENHITKRGHIVLRELVMSYMTNYMKENNLTYEMYRDVSQALNATNNIFKKSKIIKIKRKLFSNKVTLYCLYPGIIIGKYGSVINTLNKISKYKVTIKEVKCTLEYEIDTSLIVYDPDFNSYKDTTSWL